MTGDQAKAFSLIEMLITITIIIVLVALTLPALRMAKRTARQAQCANNLHQLYMAFDSRKIDRTSGTTTEPVMVGWPGLLLPYLGGDTEALICPEDESPGAGTASVILECILSGQWYFDTDLEEGPLNAKLSQTQKMIAGLSESQNQWSPPGYEPDGDPNTWWICIEDIRPGGGDNDFEDICFLINQTGTGMTIDVVKGHTNRRFNLLDGDRTPLQLDDGSDAVDISTGDSLTLASGAASYGINTQIWGKRGDSMLMALDYELPNASVVGPDATDNWDDWVDDQGQHTFARHPLHTVNTLWTDGRTETSHRSWELDPQISQDIEKLWLP